MSRVRGHALGGALLVLLFGASGCTINGKPVDIIPDMDLGGIIKVTTRPGQESILGETFGRAKTNNFTLDDERVAQAALSKNRDGVGSTWHNAAMGDLTIVPLDTQAATHGTCRNFIIKYVWIGFGRYDDKERGQACFHPDQHLWLVKPTGRY